MMHLVTEKEDWQDISTAPKDGSHILIFDAAFVFPVFYGDGTRGKTFYDNADGEIAHDDTVLWRPIPFPGISKI